MPSSHGSLPQTAHQASAAPTAKSHNSQTTSCPSSKVDSRDTAGFGASAQRALWRAHQPPLSLTLPTFPPPHGIGKPALRLLVPHQPALSAGGSNEPQRCKCRSATAHAPLSQNPPLNACGRTRSPQASRMSFHSSVKGFLRNVAQMKFIV